MKWPASIVIIRHGQSEYNVLRDKKNADPLYLEFKKAYAKDHKSAEAKRLAEIVKEKYALSVSDYATPLTREGSKQAHSTGKALSSLLPVPDVILHSPYLRTAQTLQEMQPAFQALSYVPTFPDDRVREQEHGLSLLYSDWRLFHVFHPEQKLLYELLGPYWYQYPQGESASQVRDRIRAVMTTLIREWAGKRVWLVTHHLTILSIRANLERLSPEAFIRLDEEEKPINCGVTRYDCNPDLGKAGKMQLIWYNRRFY